MTHPSDAAPALDPSEIRQGRAVPKRRPAPAPRRSRRALALAGAFAGAFALSGAGYAAYAWLAPVLLASGATKPATAITMGPLPEMPDIRDGVPAVAKPKPVRTVGTAPPAGTAVPPAGTADIRTRDAAAARALEMTVQTAALRPALPTQAPVPSVPVPAEPVLAAPVLAAPVVPAAPVATPSPRQAVASLPATPGAPVPPPRPVDTTASTGEAPPVVRSAAPPTERAPPLPPVRAMLPKPADAKPERPASAALPQTRPTAAARVPAAAPPRMPAAGVADAASPPVQRPAARPPVSERADILGVPLPDFVPQTGRRIRDAAGSIADAVSGLPDLF